MVAPTNRPNGRDTTIETRPRDGMQLWATGSRVHLRDSDIVVITDHTWEGPRRVRHKMPQAWAREGNRILWIEGPPFPPTEWKGERFRRCLKGDLREVETNIWAGAPPPAWPFIHKGGALGNLARAFHRPWMGRRIRRYIQELNFRPRYVVLMQQAARWDLLDEIPHEVSIYYCHDIYGYGFATEAMAREEARCCNRVDVVFAVGAMLTERLRGITPRVYGMPHAVSPAWWEENRLRVPSEYAQIPSPRAVYTGVLQEKMDFTLLCDAADRVPNWHFVLVGPVQEHEGMGEGLAAARQRPNIHFLGARDVNELPGFLAGADALILPYLRDANTEMAGLALKFFEYFITGKPVVVTPYTEFDVNPEGLFHVEGDGAAWAARLASIESGDELTESADRRRTLALENSYEARVRQQREALSTLD